MPTLMMNGCGFVMMGLKVCSAILQFDKYNPMPRTLKRADATRRLVLDMQLHTSD